MGQSSHGDTVSSPPVPGETDCSASAPAWPTLADRPDEGALPAPPVPPQTAGPVRRRAIQRIIWALLALALIVSAGWYVDYLILRPHRIAREINSHILSLAGRRPADMSRQQWTSAVAWTSNLHGNSLISFQTDTRTIGEFRDRLRERLDQNVDMSTIHWIWDAYAEVCPGGARYQRFRRIMLDEIEQGGSAWIGINVP